jgi:hypothetical protein
VNAAEIEDLASDGRVGGNGVVEFESDSASSGGSSPQRSWVGGAADSCGVDDIVVARHPGEGNSLPLLCNHKKGSRWERHQVIMSHQILRTVLDVGLKAKRGSPSRLMILAPGKQALAT